MTMVHCALLATFAASYSSSSSHGLSHSSFCNTKNTRNSQHNVALLSALSSLSGSNNHNNNDGKSPLVFVCNGQGSQWEGMGRDLIATSESFHDTMKELQTQTNIPLVDLFEDGSMWLDKEYSSLGISSFQLGLVKMLQDEYGVESPDLFLGHSLGEVTCAHLAGFVSAADAVRAAQVRAKLVDLIDGDYHLNVFHKSPPIGHDFVLERKQQDQQALYDYVLKETDLDPDTLWIGRHAQNLGLCRKSKKRLIKTFSLQGLMAVIGCSAEELHSTLDDLNLDETVVACYNSPTAQTVSGPQPQVQALIQHLRRDNSNLFVRELDTDGIAYHAPFLALFSDYLREEFTQTLQDLDYHSSQPSSILLPKQWKSTSDQTHWVGVDYLVNNILRSVFFQHAIQELPPRAAVVEIGPAAGLLSQIKRTRADLQLIPLVQHSKQGSSADETLQQAVQQLQPWRQQ